MLVKLSIKNPSFNIKYQNSRANDIPLHNVNFYSLNFSQLVFGQDQKRKILTPAEQKQFLAKRLPTNKIAGSFESFGSLLFAVKDVIIHSDVETIRKTALQPTFHDFYQPTWEELFNSIAAQTKSSWSYDSKLDYWVFAAPILPKPFAITIAENWTSRDMGVWIGYKPPMYPAGMDIYYWGKCTTDDPKEQTKLSEKIRNTWAMNFASKINKEVAIDEMKKVKIAGVEALFFEAPAPMPGLMWRQWAVVIDGKTFFILSTLPTEDKKFYAEVEEMIKSFHLVETEKLSK